MLNLTYIKVNRINQSKKIETSMLSIKSLSFAFQHRPLFKEINFDLVPGKLVHLIGENGTGKSTFLSLIAGFRTPNEGSISYFNDKGEEVDDRRVYIEYLSAEANGLYTKMDATQNLTFWSKLRGHKYSTQQMVEELKKWGLGHPLVRTNFAVEKFSTGMKRRLALARLNLSACPCWLLDEPIYGLDTKGIDLFKSAILNHKESGGMAFIVSHDTYPLKELIDEKIEIGAK
ncbi:MAG: heme ABC exporter ATP-binding protein CcmA [Bdellovibrionota bacterium]